ncbi:MAG TPA: PDDEXK nuclease domain-containing protein [bacterium]|nr:PDDEXK nuclease domain-containing protein [bacterium]
MAARTKKSPKKNTAPTTAKTNQHDLYPAIAAVLHEARRKAYRAVNFVMVEAYWNIGRMIVEEEQRGKGRAKYGALLLENLATRLSAEFGKGFNVTNLKYFRQFYLLFAATTWEEIRHSLRDELTWTHYRTLLRIEKTQSRDWYMQEAAEQNWSTRALERQINSLYYERLLMSRDKKTVKAEAKKKLAPLITEPHDFIKDPYVLEFLGMKDAVSFRETELEQSIIDKLQAFMLELGKGFAFVARQQRISTESKHFFVDLVFYNYILKCFVLIDLKTGELTHQDVGQMDMYVRLYEEKYKGADDNPTIGIILCTEKDATVVKYSVLGENKRLFAAKYKLYLPTEKELREEIEQQKALFIRERGIGYESR